MGYWLDSAEGIFCASCGKEVHDTKCMKGKGYIRVEFLPKRDKQGYSSCATVEFCNFECLKKADWDKLRELLIKSEESYRTDFNKDDMGI